MRIHWLIRTAAFIASVLTLSLFFAGWREFAEEGRVVSGVLVMLAGVLSTGLLLVLHGYWIYFEEKNKGTLRRHVRSYESLYKLLDALCVTNRAVRLIQPVLVQKGSNEQ